MVGLLYIDRLHLQTVLISVLRMKILCKALSIGLSGLCTLFLPFKNFYIDPNLDSKCTYVPSLFRNKRFMLDELV